MVPSGDIILIVKSLAKFIHSCWRILVRPWLGENCRFHPVCSDYALEAVERYGFFSGGFLAIQRIIRCQPYAKGGEDPVPGKIK